MKRIRRPSLKGHKLTTWRSGAQDGYANGECECGWRFPGWTHWVRDVYRSHNNHIIGLKIRLKKNEQLA